MQNLLPSILSYLGVYRIYESILSRNVKKFPMPKHIAIILDGNRRWANNKSIKRVIGHIEGANTAEELLEWCHEIGIKTITLYLLSTENLDRSPEELDELFELFTERLNKLLSDERIVRFRVRVKAIGRLELVSKRMQEILKEIEAKTADYSDHFLNIAIAYGGRTEIIDSVKKISTLVKEGRISPEQINQKTIEESLYTSYLPNPDPDLVIRTSGEERLSGFLLLGGPQNLHG